MNASAHDHSEVPQWCRTVIYLDIAVLLLAGLASVRGLARFPDSPLAVVAAALLVSKVVVGLLAGTGLLTGHPRALRIAYVAALIAVIGAVFSLAFVDAGAGVSRSSWVYQHRSGTQLLLFVWTVGWNALYVVAARRRPSRATPPVSAT